MASGRNASLQQRSRPNSDKPPAFEITPMTVVVAEDRPIVRAFLVRLLAQEMKHAVVGETDSCAGVLHLCAAHKPELLLLDVELADGGALAIVDEIRARSPNTRVLVVTAFMDEYTMVRVERCRVSGCVDKTEASVEVIVAAIDAVAAGRSFFSDAIIRAKSVRAGDPRAFTKLLSAREETVLGLCGLGLSNEEIAAQLNISANTVRNHRHSVMRKLGLAGLRDLMDFTVHHGFWRFFHKRK
jgi:DNA-binding NarL/FixJ family response regulator